MSVNSFALLSYVNSYQQLCRELASLIEQQWFSHVNSRDYCGDWDVLPLRCAQEHQLSHGILQSFAIDSVTSWHNLPSLQQCPALLQFINTLPYQIKSARLMRLHPGALIKPHRDQGLSLEHGEARLHLPLQTNAQLSFFVNNQRVPMQAGELWYINADQLHWVENKGETARINLVLDCEVNQILREQVYAASTT